MTLMHRKGLSGKSNKLVCSRHTRFSINNRTMAAFFWISGSLRLRVFLRCVSCSSMYLYLLLHSSQSTSQSTNQSVNQPVSQSINQSTNQSIDSDQRATHRLVCTCSSLACLIEPHRCCLGPSSILQHFPALYRFACVCGTVYQRRRA
jgi:hypothetical protein